MNENCKNAVIEIAKDAMILARRLDTHSMMYALGVADGFRIVNAREA